MEERSITPEMIREAEEELGLRDIIDAGLTALSEGDISEVITDAVVAAVEIRQCEGKEIVP